jgi:23S rRNA pseudouridine2605 synthase
VNGSTCRELSTRIGNDDDVRVSGRRVTAFAPRTILLNKPAGYTTTRSDRHADRTIFDLLPTDTGHLFHVGRLDKESEGLLLLTNDGILAQDLMHPSKGVDKEYEVILDRPFTEHDAAALKRGTWIEGSVARVESVRTLGATKIQIVLHQGLKRQIRVMLGQLGFKVQRLVRTRLGPLTLRGVKPGSYRDLRPDDLEVLRKALTAPKPKKERPKFLPKPKGMKFAQASGTRFALKDGSSSARRGMGTGEAQERRGSPSKRPRKTSPTQARLRKGA